MKFGLGFVTLGIVPRALGPEMYGNYGFLTVFFGRTTKFLKLGVTSAYYTKLSARPDETKLIGFYFYYILILLTVLFLITFVPVNFNFVNYLLPGQDKYLIFYAALFAGLQFIFNSIQTTQDSLGNTVLFEKIILVQSVTITSSIIILYNYEILTIKSLLINHCIISILCTFIGIYSFKIIRLNFFENLYLKKIEFIKYVKEFFSYSHPLIVHGFIVFFTAISDRWLLQTYHGSYEQGYFTLAFKIAGVLFLFSSAISTLLARDFSNVFNKKGKDELKKLFSNYFGPIYFIASYFSIFVSSNSEVVTSFIGGDSYSNSSLCISIFALYPIHQICGQITGSIFLAINRTNIIRNVGIFGGILGLTSSFIIIPSYALNLGSQALCIKLIIVQFILVNINLFIICKYFEIRFFKILISQLFILTILYLLILLLKYILNYFHADGLLNLIILGFLFTFISFVLLSIFPKLFLLGSDTHFLKRLFKPVHSLLKA